MEIENLRQSLQETESGLQESQSASEKARSEWEQQLHESTTAHQMLQQQVEVSEQQLARLATEHVAQLKAAQDANIQEQVRKTGLPAFQTIKRISLLLSTHQQESRLELAVVGQAISRAPCMLSPCLLR